MSEACEARPQAFISKAFAAEQMRQQALRKLEEGELGAAEAEARKVLALELGNTLGRAKSLTVLVKILLAKEPGLQELAELKESSLDLMSQKRATLSDCVETCQLVAEHGFDRLLVQCLQRLRQRDCKEERAELNLAGAQILAARVEEASHANSVEKEFATDSLCTWLEEADGEDLGHVLWGLARALQPQEALLWLQKALAFLPEGPLWHQMAFCHHALGDGSNRRRCLEAAERNGATSWLSLLDAAQREDVQMLRRLLGAARRGELQLRAGEVAYVVQELKGTSLLRLEVIDLLLELLAQEPVGELTVLKVWRHGLEVAAELGPQHVLERLGRELDEETRTWLLGFLSALARGCERPLSWHWAARLRQEIAGLLPQGPARAAECANVARALLAVKPKRADPLRAETLQKLSQEALQWIEQGLAMHDDVGLRELEVVAKGRLGHPVQCLKGAWEAMQEHPGVAIDMLKTYESSDVAKALAAGRELIELLKRHQPSELPKVLHQQLQRLIPQKITLTSELLWLAANAWNVGAALPGDALGAQLLQQAVDLLEACHEPEVELLRKEMAQQMA